MVVETWTLYFKSLTYIVLSPQTRNIVSGISNIGILKIGDRRMVYAEDIQIGQEHNGRRIKSAVSLEKSLSVVLCIQRQNLWKINPSW